MQIIELFEQDIRTNDRQSSKGNQLKWKKNEIWYKADYTGYEGLAETVISGLLKSSTLASSEFVRYEPVEIRYKTRTFTGVASEDFLKNGWQIITLERLFRTFSGASLTETLWQMTSVEDRFLFITDQVERITHLKDFGEYLNILFTIDALFLNEDRHMHNIAVLMNEKGLFDYCPVFDNGAGLLADTTFDYPMDGDLFLLMDSVKAKTISADFDEQLDISEKICGSNISFSFNRQDVTDILKTIEIYPEAQKKRVEDIIAARMRKYCYLFK